jgi:hypothetical protein
MDNVQNFDSDINIILKYHRHKPTYLTSVHYFLSSRNSADSMALTTA